MKYVINTDKPKDCKAEILSCIKNQKDKSGSEIMRAWLKPLGYSNIDRINAIRKEVLYKEMER